MLSLIVATGLNNEIGLNGTMPWHLPEDLKYFSTVTKGHTIIMGRKTFQSLPKVLPGRKHIVITRDENFCPDHPMVETAKSLEEGIKNYIDRDEEAFIIGGAQIYNQALPYCNKLYITRIQENFDADTYFPAFDEDNYNNIEASEIMESENNGLKYQFVVYTKKKGFH